MLTRKPSIWKKKNYKKAINLFLVLLIFVLSLPLILPFFHLGYFPTHDGEWAVVRLGAMHRAFLSGHFPVRWAGNLNFSYGYPLFLFTYPLPYYLGEIFNLIGFGLVGSIKLLFILSVIFSGLTMFWLGKEIFGSLGGLVMAVFYLYAPFRLVDLYVRGSLGESLAFVFFPLLFLAFLKVSRGNFRWVSFGALLLASLILTHNVYALLFTPFLIIWAICLIYRVPAKNRKKLVLNYLLLLVLGFGLSVFFLLPALVEKSEIALSQISLTDISQHFVNLSQLIKPNWGYGSPGTEDAFSFQLGWIHLVGLATAFVFWLKAWRQRAKLSGFVFCFSLISLLTLILLMMPVSLLFWQKTPLFSEIDFPWRLLGPASFFLALCLGYLTHHRLTRLLVVFLAILGLLVNLKYAKPQGVIDYPDEYYLTNEATTTSHDELMPLWVKKKPVARPASRVEVIIGEVSIGPVFENAKQIRLKVDAKTESEIQLNTIYFPGWQVKVDDQVVPVAYDNERGLMRLKVIPGKHYVTASFGETPFWLIADLISLFSLAAVFLVGITQK